MNNAPATGLPQLAPGFLYSTVAGNVVCIRARRTVAGEHPETWLLQQYERRGPTLDWWWVKRGDVVPSLTSLRARRGTSVMALSSFTAKRGGGAPTKGNGAA